MTIERTRRQPGPERPTAQQTTSADGKIGGTISRIVPDRGFGFIVTPDRRDYFFHFTDLIDRELSQIEVGDPVRFRPEMRPKGLRAEAIEVLA